MTPAEEQIVEGWWPEVDALAALCLARLLDLAGPLEAEELRTAVDALGRARMLWKGAA